MSSTSSLSKLCRCALIFALLLIAATARAEIASKWIGTNGNWNDAAHWDGGPPVRNSQVTINGADRTPVEVTVNLQDVLISHVAVGEPDGSHATLAVSGPSFTVIGTVDIGKYTGSDGRLVVNSGDVFAGTFFLSGGGGPGQAGKGVIEIAGGSVVTKDFELGASAGCASIVHVIGSKALAIAAEDGLHIGVYNYLSQEKNPAPSNVELIFDVDAEGVTPIYAWGKTEGRVNFPVPDGKGNGLGTCKLQVNLLAPPPSGDLLLIGCANASQGTFTGLPEGSIIQASFAGKTYQWNLTYRGGTNHCAIMLTEPMVRAANGSTTAHTSPVAAKHFAFDHGVIDSAYQRLYAQIDSQLPVVGGKVLAFPGAQGFGAFTPGGRAGKILFVTNLNDSGPGSLREAIETKGPRTVIFRVGGIITTKGLAIREPNITIAGQTAPGDGICIRKSDGNAPALLVDGTHDVVIRFLRVRAGNNTGEFRGEGFRADNTDNFIIDHCSCSWGNPETLSASGTVDRFTVQWCIVSEGNNEQHHAFATIIGGDCSTWHHNLFAHMQSRIPRWGDITVQCDFRNNVLYDWGGNCGYGDFRTLNYVNNYLRPGVDTKQKYYISNPKVPLPSSLYISGNVVPGFPIVAQDNWVGVDADKSLRSPTPFPAPPVQMQSAEEAFTNVLKNAGATLPKRDSVDARAVSDTKNGTGKIINNENDVGGWPAYASGTPPPDSSIDGIPAAWKKAHGLPLDDPALANKFTREGYSVLEVYLNSLVPADVIR